MKSHVLYSALVLILTLACNAQQERKGPDSSKPHQAPFLLSMVPSDSRPEPFGPEIIMRNVPNLYVVLANISKEPQAVFESWNSWGYSNLSFEIQTRDGHVFAVSKKLASFTRNFPSIFIIAPGEHMVFPINLNDDWNSVPPPRSTPTPITIKAIYEVSPSTESAGLKVWTGRLESRAYNVKIIYP